MRFMQFFLVATGLFVIVLIGLFQQTVHADTANIITVTTVLDSVANDGQCSFREAVIAANTDMPGGSAAGECPAGNGADTILFNSMFTSPVNSFVISSDITILGGSETRTTLAGHHFVIESGNVVFKNVELKNDVPAPPIGRLGGAIYAGEGVNLTLENVEIKERVTGDGDATTPGGDGGAVYFAGDHLLLMHSIIRGNTTGRGGLSAGTRAGNGAGLYIASGSTVDINFTVITNNHTGGPGNGGALYVESGATVTALSSTIAYNEARGDFYGISRGGGIYGQVALDSTILGNNSADDGSDCYGTLHSITGSNLLSDDEYCAFDAHATDRVNVDPLLQQDPLAGWYPLAGSPVLEQGLCYTGAEDVFYHPRPVDLPEVANGAEACDIGAVEVSQYPTQPTPTSTPTETPDATPTPTGTPTLVPTPLPQGDIAVNTVEDAIANDGFCSLREAITAANTDTASGIIAGECAAGEGADTITVPPGTYKLTLLYPGENQNAAGDYDIRSPITLLGSGEASTIIDGRSRDRLFHIFDTEVTIAGMTIRNGYPPRQQTMRYRNREVRL